MKEVNSGREFNAGHENKAFGREFASPKEHKSVERNRGGKEQNTSSMTVSLKKKERKLSDRIKRIFLGVAGAAVLTVAVILPAHGPKAEIALVDVTDTSISYEIEVPETEMKVTLIAENDFTRREEVLLPGTNSGTIEGLRPDMTYTLKVVGKNGVLSLSMAEQSVRTDKDPPVTEFLSVTHECTCNVDGLFHFTMDFVDENAWWSQFEATLTDVRGNVGVCSFLEDVHAPQSIDVVGSGLVGNTATFTISCVSTQNDPAGERIVLYQVQVKI